MDLDWPATKKNKELALHFVRKGIRLSMILLDKDSNQNLEVGLRQWTVPVGVLLDGSCEGAENALEKASKEVLFDAMHMWLILENFEKYNSSRKLPIHDILQRLNLSVDADIVVARKEGLRGLRSSNEFKYYERWNFNNLTLRAITVILDRPKVFDPKMLADPGYTPGVSVMTKIVTQLLWVLKDKHNFRTKFYYLILDTGVGDYENRFLTPLSPGVWWWTIASCIAFTVILAFTAVLEDRQEPGLYASFSVFAIICQQGRRMILLVVGLMSMLLYNYYTSSVVSWLLNAAAPTLADMDALINTDLELVFEDIGYTRGWLDNPGFFYYSGYKNPKEDILRTKKVTNAKRTTPLLQPVATGVNLIRSGQYAYHTEPYTAYQVISKTFEDKELCELGSLQMMAPAYVYIMAQKRSPYKQFFVWRLVSLHFIPSLMRLNERGHLSVARARASGFTPTCSGQTPRALALGQAAPAFAILAQVALFSLLILVCEIIYHRIQHRKQIRILNTGERAPPRQNDSDGE
ncbi:jg20951 [Pararge aegeria aegeria]|uniref:Jg20951 protein n=1 Tax=Pararge aegeria aegeria TaxID=348720 RepID=A0A8S4QMV5_9NEOP|nr:jg20951 [Pararge aegeria aegeria]